MEWEIVIGLETHAQLSTQSKMFSGAATAFGAPPNTQACTVDIALPGVLPVANKGAVERAIRFGLAVGATIQRRAVFARKNYFYPDLPKGYQISQYERPIVQGGSIAIVAERGEKVIRLTRAHLEEDAGKSLHERHGLSAIDLNRAGIPLLEIVSEPDLRSAAEAVAYAKVLHGLVRWLDICDGNMQEGSFRCDANVSVRPAGATTLGTRCEIKNLNSFRFLERAIECEARRQIAILEERGEVVQQTVLYDPDRDRTAPMRSKEEAHDYRYFPDPDLLPLEVTSEWIEEVRAKLPELPAAKRSRYGADFALSSADAITLTQTRDMADYFEEVVAALRARFVDAPIAELAKLAANWVMGEFAGALNKADIDVAQSPLASRQLAGLLARIRDRTVSGKIAKEVFDALWRGEAQDADALIEERGLTQISDPAALAAIVNEVVASNARQVEDFRAGKEKALNALVGQVMKRTAGKADPAQVATLIRQKLGG